MARQYQVYLRKHELAPWEYGDTFSNANDAMTAQNIIRDAYKGGRRMAAKVVASGYTVDLTQDNTPIEVIPNAAE